MKIAVESISEVFGRKKESFANIAVARSITGCKISGNGSVPNAGSGPRCVVER